MNTLLATQLNEALTMPLRHRGALIEDALRVAAGTLDSAVGDEITATTVVGVLGADDVEDFQALVDEVADKFDVDARVKLHVGSFSVRLSRRSAVRAG